MSPILREVLRFVAIGLGFGFIWAAIQYANGQMRNIDALAAHVLVFGLAGFVMWVTRRIYLAIRNRS